MRNKQLLILSACLLMFSSVWAQQGFTITDKQPALVNGLEIGFNIKSAEVKKVSDKGDFSRYSVRFYVTNTLGEDKIILYKQGLNLLNNVSDMLVQFNCVNATGARLTSKEALIRATACNVLALTDDKDCATNKTVKNKRFVQIGYWIKAGQTISTDAIVIVPLNELPNVQAIYLANQLQPTASASVGGGQATYYDQGQPPPPPQSVINTEGFIKIRNARINTYINNETGVLRQSVISSEWWSAHWQLIPVQGTNFFNIKNKWKGNFLGFERGIVDLYTNGQEDGSLWTLEPSGNGNLVRLKNVATGQYLCIGSNQLKLTSNFNNVATSEWVFEQ